MNDKDLRIAGLEKALKDKEIEFDYEIELASTHSEEKLKKIKKLETENKKLMDVLKQKNCWPCMTNHLDVIKLRKEVFELRKQNDKIGEVLLQETRWSVEAEERVEELKARWEKLRKEIESHGKCKVYYHEEIMEGEKISCLDAVFLKMQELEKEGKS
jgi:hypothetical protein